MASLPLLPRRYLAVLAAASSLVANQKHVHAFPTRALLERCHPRRSYAPQRWKFSVAATTSTREVGTEKECLRLPLQTAVHDLQQLLQANRTGALVRVEGYVITKRGFGNSFCFVDIADASSIAAPVQVVWKRQDAQQQQQYFDGYTQCLLPGIRIAVTGVVAPSRHPGEALLRAQTLAILLLPRNPQHVRIVLQAVQGGRLPGAPVARAAAMATGDLEAALLPPAAAATDPASAAAERLYGLAKAVVAALPPPAADYPVDVLAAASQRGVYTLPAPDAKLATPPARLVSRQRPSPPNPVGRCDGVSAVEPWSVQGLHESMANRTAATAAAARLTIPLDRVVGWVQNRRRFRDQITVLEIAHARTALRGPSDDDHNDEDDSNLTPPPDEPTWRRHHRLASVLHPAVYTAAAADCAMMGTLLAPGSKVQLEGYYDDGPAVVGDDDGDAGKNSASSPSPSAVFWVTRVRLLRASWRPTTVQYLIELYVKGAVDPTEAAMALGLSTAAANDLFALHQDDLTARQWKAAEFSAALQKADRRVSSTLVPGSGDSRIRVLDRFANLRARHPTVHVEAPATAGGASGRDGSRWKRRKEPQLEWIAQQVKEVIASHPHCGQRPLQILDVGGGKGLLANHLATQLGDSVEITVIDVAQRAVQNGAMRSVRRQLPVRYTVGDASQTELSGIDVVVALHACGALTDVAMGHAVVNRACFVICPCCFRSNPLLRVGLPTIDRSGCNRVGVDEWLGVDPSDYDALKLLAEVQGDMALANQAIHTICALQAAALQRTCRSNVEVSIRTFPVAFSSRNFCLVGRYPSS